MCASASFVAGRVSRRAGLRRAGVFLMVLFLFWSNGRAGVATSNIDLEHIHAILLCLSVNHFPIGMQLTSFFFFFFTVLRCLKTNQTKDRKNKQIITRITSKIKVKINKVQPDHKKKKKKERSKLGRTLERPRMHHEKREIPRTDSPPSL